MSKKRKSKERQSKATVLKEPSIKNQSAIKGKADPVEIYILVGAI